MSRRVRTLITGCVLLLILAIVAVALPVPYVILGPGPTINTLGSYAGQTVIGINGKQANAVTGHLNLTTVSVSTGRVSVFQALTGWLEHDRVVVPRETIYPPGESEQQVNQQDSADFSDSQNSAEAAAFCELGYPKGFGIIGVSTEVKPAGALKSGDRLVSLDGASISSQTALEAVLAKQTPGKSATIDVVRDGAAKSVQVTLLSPASGKTGARIGIEVGTTCFASFDVSLGLNQEIGGPSAGMMFALGIMEKVGSVDLTGGRFVAGTGTIDPTGAVGAIGGIQLKMIAARRAGATLFLAPASNCTDVQGNVPKGLTVAKVSTLHQAVQVLEETKAGQQVPGC